MPFDCNDIKFSRIILESQPSGLLAARMVSAYSLCLTLDTVRNAELWVLIIHVHSTIVLCLSVSLSIYYLSRTQSVPLSSGRKITVL